MVFIQDYKKDTFQYQFLNQIKDKLHNIDLKCYFGFDFGFFNGVNIYYGSKYNDYAAKKLYKLMKRAKINVRMLSNIDYDYDLIVLFGYINLASEKERLNYEKKTIMKTLSFFLRRFFKKK